MAYRGFSLHPSTSPAERVLFGAACDVNTRCWTWLGCLDPQGYSMTTIRGISYKAHRVSYEVFVGPIPDGLQIDHLCRNRACVNPEHLEAVTPQVNMRRGESPGAVSIRRTHCRVGHDFATHGVVRAGRRVCRPCAAAYAREYRAQRRQARADQWVARLERANAA